MLRSLHKRDGTRTQQEDGSTSDDATDIENETLDSRKAINNNKDTTQPPAPQVEISSSMTSIDILAAATAAAASAIQTSHSDVPVSSENV